MFPTVPPNHTDLSTMPVAFKPDRPKTTTACYNCRQRKLRCDGSKPSCSNCLLYLAECSYAQGRNKSGPLRGSKRLGTVDPDRPPRAKRSRRFSSGTSPQSSSDTSTRSASPVDNASDIIPSLLGPLSSEWLTEWGVSWSDQPVQSSGTISDNFATTWNFPGTENDNILLNTNPLIPNFLSASTPLPFLVRDDLPPSTNLPIVTGTRSVECQISNLPTPQSLNSLDFPSPQSTPAPSALFQTDNAQSKPHPFDLQQQEHPSDLHALRLIHAFVPIFLFRELAEIISDCETRKAHSIHAAFFFNAFHSLSAVASVRYSSAPLPQQQPGCYVAAQQQAMQAYFALISHDSSVVGRDACYTAAGLVYLAVRGVFTHGWGKETSTWLRFAADIVDYLPLTSSMDLGFQCWLARIVWLWDKALTCCEPELPSVLTNASDSLLKIIRDVPALGALEFDEEQHTLSGLIELCMDLERQMAKNEGLPAVNGPALGEDFWSFTGLPTSVILPLCQRVQSWIKSSSVAQEFFLQFDTNFKSDDEVRNSVGRVLHLVYYSMAIKLNNVDRVQCSLKKTSLIVALSRLIDAADWIVTTRRLYLWPFAERALRFAMDHLLGQSEPTRKTFLSAAQNTYWSLPSPPRTNPASPIEVSFQSLPKDASMMLSLIKDVFIEAHSVLDPTTASAQKTSAGRAVESISIVLQWQGSSKPNLPIDPSSSDAILTDLGQFFTTMSPQLLSLQNSENR